MTPETLFRYCFAAVTGTGFGLITVMILLGIVAAICGISPATERGNEEE